MVATFAPAESIRVDNYSTQYLHLVEPDDYAVPGQVNKVIFVGGITRITLKFEAPPNVSQAAATPGQIGQMWTYEAGVPGAPLGPSPGNLLPIGLDQPQHFHNHTHGSHSHSHAHGTHAHGHSATHTHTTPNHFHTVPVNNNGGVPAGAQVFYDGVSLNAAQVGGGEFTDTSGSGTSSSNAPGSTDLASVAADATPTTPAADTTLENVQHTHP